MPVTMTPRDAVRRCLAAVQAKVPMGEGDQPARARIRSEVAVTTRLRPVDLAS